MDSAAARGLILGLDMSGALKLITIHLEDVKVLIERNALQNVQSKRRRSPSIWKVILDRTAVYIVFFLVEHLLPPTGYEVLDVAFYLEYLSHKVRRRSGLLRSSTLTRI